MDSLKSRKAYLLRKLRDTSRPGVVERPCAACGKPIIVNRRSYTSLSGSIFCQACMQRSEEEMEALLENPQSTFLGYAARPLPDDVIILKQKRQTKKRLTMRMTVGLSLCLRMWRRVGQHGALTSASDRTMHRRRIFDNSYNPFTCDVYAFGWRVSGGRE